MSTSNNFGDHSIKSPQKPLYISSPKINYEFQCESTSVAASEMADVSKVDLEVNEPKKLKKEVQIGSKENEEDDVTNILGPENELHKEILKKCTVELNSEFLSNQGQANESIGESPKSVKVPKPNMLDSCSEETDHHNKKKFRQVNIKNDFFDTNQLPETSKKIARTKPSNHSIDAELEDGEVTGNDENDLSQTTPKGSPNICRFFLRKTCTWGNKCRFDHPASSNYGNYVMFEKKELPVSVSPIMSTEAWNANSFDGLTDLESSFDRNLHCVKQMMQHTGYLPPPQTRKHPAQPPMVTFSFNDSAPFYTQFQPGSSVERVALLPTPANGKNPKNKGPHTSTPYEKYRSPQLATNHQQCAADSRHDRHVWSDPWMSSKSRTLKRKSKRISSSSSRSPFRSSASSDSPSKFQESRQSRLTVSKERSSRFGRRSFRGPRTPSLSPPRKLLRNVTNAPRKRRPISSSSSSCTDSVSTSYDSTTNSSSSKDSNTHRSRNSKRKTLSQKSPSAIESADRHKKIARLKNCSSKKSRQEYLLMKLLVVEEQIAKKKKIIQ